MLITSATPTDQSGTDSSGDGTSGEAGDTADAWQAAEARLGVNHMTAALSRLSLPSPFDYARQTRILIVHDLKRGDLNQLAAAYRALFLASGGGALGLFTAIARLDRKRTRLNSSH